MTDLIVLFLREDLCYVAQAGLKLEILLPLPPNDWDYRHKPSHLACNA
jgi:hypothetical protein